MLQIAVNITIYTLPDVTGIFITAQFVINSPYIISDDHAGPTELGRLAKLWKPDSTDI